jgi:hypothetical protein
MVRVLKTVKAVSAITEKRRCGGKVGVVSGASDHKLV